MTRDDAYALLTEYTKTPSLIGHALAVEAAMRFYAAKLGGDPDEWAAVGLLHDMDYEQWPSLEDHPFRGAEIMRARGVPEHWVLAALSHGDHTGVPRETPMQKALFAVDELTGFIIACALVRPSRSLADLGAKSVKKKMKDRSFAAKVNRADIEAGAAILELPLEEHIENVIEAMRGIEGQLGLGAG